MLNRRELLGGAGLTFVSLAGGGPGLFARAAEESARAGANDHALVVVELAGGNDGLNTVIPYEDDRYYKNRKTLGVPKNGVIKLNDRVGLHPKLGALGELFKEGRVAVVQGVGYPQPDRSHFRSMEIWHTASVDPRPPAAGWLGRYLDVTHGPQDRDAFPRGLALSGSLPQAFQAETVSVPVAAQLESALGDPSQPESALRRKLSTATVRGDGPLGFLRRQADTLYRTAEQMQKAAEKYQSTVEYPGDDLAQQLRRAAQLLAADLGVRVLFVSQDGYDTHAEQGEQHGNLLEVLSNSLAAFQKDLTALKLADKVTVLVFSEFGRRVDENASKGTDHGAASCLFLVGAKVKGGLAGQYPSLEKLGEGDLVFNTDFRSVYAAVLGRWLGCPAEQALGQAFPPLDVI